MENLLVIRTKEEVLQVIDYLKDKEYVAFDTETTGLGKEARIIGFSIAAESDLGIYVVTQEWNVEKQELITLETAELAKEFMVALTTKKLIMHNGVFDCRIVKDNYDVLLIDRLHTDTTALAHLLDENRSVKLKDLGTIIFGESAKEEERIMKESIQKNGGKVTKEHYELYKADSELIGRYGAKDAILTLNLFYYLVPQLYEQNLDKFFYEDESMPLFRGPTYSLNTVGMRVDPDKASRLRGELEAENLELKAFIYKEITPFVSDKYPGTKVKNTFNLNSNEQMAWLLFERLGNEFYLLTDAGRELCKLTGHKPPYASKDKVDFIVRTRESKGTVYKEAGWNYKTKKMAKAKKVRDYWTYCSTGAKTMTKLAKKYKWVEALIKYNKNEKLLKTYVMGIQEKVHYNIIYPSFKQHGTTSGRYSSSNPNFQNLPKKDKRIKSFVVSRPGKVFVGADYSQLEPRVFASVSQDPTLLAAFKEGKDFYSVVGIPIFGVTGCSLYKDDENSFANKHPKLRDLSKAFALATPYGTSAFRQSQDLDKPVAECQQIIDRYFAAYPKVELMMLESHEMAKKDGVVYNLYGRPRRIPAAKEIEEVYGQVSHSELPYEARTLLNLGMNHRVQSSAASIVNRSAIACYAKIKDLAQTDKRWNDVNIVLQVHDEIILEGPEALSEQMVVVLKDAMENTVKLPGVDLIAEPKVAKNLADLK